MSTTAITVLGLAEGVCKATASLIDVFNSGRQLRRREMNEHKIRIDYFLRSEYARQSGELVRVHIEEIAKSNSCFYITMIKVYFFDTKGTMSFKFNEIKNNYIDN